MEKKKKYFTDRTISKSNIKSVDEPKSIPVTRKYMTAHFPWYSHLNQKTCNT